MTLTDFLLARIAEDEANARDRGADAMAGVRWKHYPEDAYVEVQSLTLAHSRRVLAECEAKRRIVEALGEAVTANSKDVGGLGIGSRLLGLLDAVHCLSLPYADHPDYREEWKP